MRWKALASGLVIVGLLPVPATALETDQFYAWTRPLADATAAINEKINTDIAEAIARVNARHAEAPCPCRVVQNGIRDQFYYLIIARPELWAAKTSEIARIPANPEEEKHFERDGLYGGSSPVDTIRLMPLSPTIEVAGVRFGTDKLGHFFADGAEIEDSYRRAVKKGASEDDALRQAIDAGIAAERTVWGMSSSGIFSVGDLEANYQGLLFYRGLCDGPDPALARDRTGWRLKRRFDLGAYVTPKWDESWQPNIYSPARWATVKPVMARYCALLRDPDVRRRRAAYAARDRETPTGEAIRRLVASGKLADPQAFTIESVCRRGR
jgi:hypothetical protein